MAVRPRCGLLELTSVNYARAFACPPARCVRLVAPRSLERVTSGQADFGAIAELAELGIDELEPEAVEQLRALVAQDRRVVRGPVFNTLIEDDDWWVSEVRAVLSGAFHAGEERENLRGGKPG